MMRLGQRYESAFEGVRLPKSITPERVAILLPRLRDGDLEVIGELVDGYMRLALSRVKYVRAMRNDCSDLTGVALLALMESLVSVAQGKMANHDNLTAYIQKRIHGALIEAICDDTVIRVPRSKTVREMIKQQGYTAAMPQRVGINWNDGGGVSEKQSADGPVLTEHAVMPELIKNTEMKNIVLNDYLKNTCTSREMSFIRLKEEGYDDQVIARKLGVDRKTIYRLKEALKARLMELLK